MAQARLTLSLAVALLCGAAGSGRAGEIILVDPSPAPARGSAAGSAATIGNGAAVAMVPGRGGIVVVSPDGTASPPGARDRIDDSRARARDWFGSDKGGTDDPAVLVIAPNATLVLAEPGKRLDSGTQLSVNTAKSRIYSQGGKPCGTVVAIGNIGDGPGGAPRGNTIVTNVMSSQNGTCN